MKTFIKNITIISLVVFSFSCNDFLLTESKSNFTEDVVFTSIDFAEKAILGCYAEMAANSVLGRSFVPFFNSDTDTEMLTGDETAERRHVPRYTANEGNNTLSEPWNSLYKIVERANICLENLKPGSYLREGNFSREAERLWGEAITLRAWAYYELMTNWGDVPWCGESFKEGVPFYKPKTDRDSIYEVLIGELKEAEKYVPWMRQIGTTERINKGYIKGLRTMMAMQYAGYALRNGTLETRRGRNWQEYYRIARDESRELIESGQHRLHPGYETFFRMLHEYKMDLTYGECLWEYPFGRGYTGQIAYYVSLSVAGANPKFGVTAGEVGTSAWSYYSHDRKDLRRNTNVELYRWTETTTVTPSTYQQSVLPQNATAFKLCKFRKTWIDPPMNGAEGEIFFTGVNWPLMRYADVLLLFAEAENEVEGYPTDDAQEALKMVRRRAFKEEDWLEKVDEYVADVSVDKETFFNAIVDERSWELMGEFKRKKDLVRWNLLGEKLNKVREECRKMTDFNTEAFKAEYKDLIPEHIYWYLDPGDNETVIIYNPDFPALNDAGINFNNAAAFGTWYQQAGYVIPAGAVWQRTNWIPLLYSNANQLPNFEDFVSRIGYGFNPAKNNHLVPIHITAIEESRGYLTNDQIHK